MKLDNNQQALFELLRAGLWEKEVRLLSFEGVDYVEVHRLAREQSVVGLLAAGVDYLKLNDTGIPKEFTLQMAGEVLQIEQRNREMNLFVADLIENLRNNGVYAMLVKGQGIAQCYKRPLWRSAGDVDLLLSNDNYQNAVNVLTPLAKEVEEEIEYRKHLGFKIDKWEVELHGNLRIELWKRIDRVLDDVQKEISCGRSVRSWQNGSTQVFLPGAGEEVVYVFAHVLQHFFNLGIGLRQICDWCRLLWKYRSELDVQLLESRIRAMGIMSEWRAFAALAVEYLGMPAEAMPMYSGATKWSRKASRIMRYVLRTGNMGHNRDLSFRQTSGFVVRKARMFGMICGDCFRQMVIFPVDAVRAWWGLMKVGSRSLVA